jgi:hypothetical protein
MIPNVTKKMYKYFWGISPKEGSGQKDAFYRKTMEVSSF